MSDEKIRFACPGCGAALAVPADRAGKSGKCPKCAAKISVPGGGTDFSLENVGGLLAVRVHLKSELAEAAAYVTKELAGDLGLMLVYDFPNSVAPVPKKHFESWGLSVDEAFAKGLARVRQAGLLERNVQEGPDGVRLGMMADAKGENLFAATHVLFFKEYFGEECPKGVLFSLPQRRCVLYHPILDQGLIPSLDLMLRTTADMHREGPHSLSVSLYWWLSGRIKHLPVRVEGAQIRFDPPEVFVKLLDTLPPVPSAAPRVRPRTR